MSSQFASPLKGSGFGVRWQAERDTALANKMIIMPSTSQGQKKLAWPHAPVHELSGRGTYFVTAGTYLKDHFFRTADRLQVLHRGLLTVLAIMIGNSKRGPSSRTTRATLLFL